MGTGASPAARLGRWSIGSRIALWYTGSVILLILLTGRFLHRSLETLLDQQVARSLAEKVHIVVRLLGEAPLDLAAVRHEVEEDWGHNVYAGVWLRVYDPVDHRVIAQTPGMPDCAGPEHMPSPGAEGDEPGRIAEVFGPDSVSFRVMSALAPVAPPAGDGRTAPAGQRWQVHAVLAYQRETELLARYRRELVLIVSIVAICTVPLGLLIARRVLAAMRSVSAQVQDLSSATLHRRLSLDGLPSELVDLAAVLNATLDRLQESFERLSRFSSDLAHELRTPLNNLRGEVEVTLSRPRAPERYREVLESALEEGERLGDIVERMLFLARAENTQEPVSAEPRAVAVELERVREYYDAAAQEAGISLSLDASPDLVAPLDPVLFNRAVANLVANALDHTPAGGRVVVSATAGQDGAGVVVGVSDSGCGIPPEHVDKVFGRFHRVDPSRTAGKGGVGLGLSIVQSIARLHGGRAELESQPGRGTTVRLILPRGRP